MEMFDVIEKFNEVLYFYKYEKYAALEARNLFFQMESSDFFRKELCIIIDDIQTKQKNPVAVDSIDEIDDFF